jgi:nucleoside-diphosphate-sugar epimerase
MNALVTGGGGFLGAAIVRRLVARGNAVRSLSRRRYAALDALGVRQHFGDVADPGTVEPAAAGCDVVFHVAAKAGIWGSYRDYYRTNVVGTDNVVAACRRQGIRRLVFTSSPSVVFDGRDVEFGTEAAPYPKRYEAHYPKTKAIAERRVVAANGSELATVALRPHLIWGPGDNHLVPRLLARARAGKLRRVGRADRLVDTTYIDNAAEAHLLAAARLAPGSTIAGRAYFISNGRPVPLWDFVDDILAAAGLPPLRRSIPAGVAYTAGWLLETAYGILGIDSEPPMTRFLARQLATAHWFDITAARRDLDYRPLVSVEEGLRRLAEYFRSPWAGLPSDASHPARPARRSTPA